MLMVVVSLKLTACVCRVALWSATRSRLKRWQGKRDSGDFCAEVLCKYDWLGEVSRSTPPTSPSCLYNTKVDMTGKRDFNPKQIIPTDLSWLGRVPDNNNEPYML